MIRSRRLMGPLIGLVLCLGTAPAWGVTYTWVPEGYPGQPYWVHTANWNPSTGVPDSPDDIAIFDASANPSYATNTHTPTHTVKEARFATSSSWHVYNSVHDIWLDTSTPGGDALLTQNGSGTVLFDCDLKLVDDTIFGGTGGGTITVNGSQTAEHTSYGPRHGVFGDGGLVKNGSFDLVLNNLAGYQGPTAINDGALLFNGESLVQNPNWNIPGEPPWIPTTQGPVAVNPGGTLGGSGILRAPVTVNSGGTFSPGESAGVFTVDSLALVGGSNTLVELGGLTPGNGTGHHDQTVVNGQLSLGGTLDVTTVGGFQPVGQFVLFQYDSLDPGAGTFDAVNCSSLPGYEFQLDYGTGTSSEVVLQGVKRYYFTGTGAANNDWWMTQDNWDPNSDPGSNDTADLIIFDDAHSPSRRTTNTHNHHHYAGELRFDTSDSWRLHNSVWDVYLSNPVGDEALFTQNGSGPLTIDCDLRLDESTIFGGTGSGQVTVNGSLTAEHSTHGPRHGVYGNGNLIKEGTYTLELENVAGYQGSTTIDEGTLLFNAESAVQNPNWALPGEPAWIPTTQGPVSVNSGGTLGGTGILRAPVTVNSGGTFSPGESAGVFTVDSLSLAAGSNTLVELGGMSPGNGTGHHDQTIVNGQLGLGGTLDVTLVGGLAPTKGDSFAIFQYGTLDPGADSFDTVNYPALTGQPANYQWSIDYGTGTGSNVTLSVEAMPYYYTRGHATDDWWGQADNWNYPAIPGSNPAEGDVVVFALDTLPSYAVNTHAGSPYTVKEIRFENGSDWRFYNPHRDIGLEHPESGGHALFRHDGSGTVTLDCDLILNDDTVFGGTSTAGQVVVNRSPFHSSTHGPGLGVTGSGGLTLDGVYTLVFNDVASYQGPTVINSGRLVFNAESAAKNPAWTSDPATWYLPVAMDSVTVNSGGELAGTGTLWAEVTVASGGQFSPGESPGVMTVGGLALESGSDVLIELSGTSPGNGNGFHDQVIVGDPLGLGLGGQLSLGGTLTVEFVDGFTPQPSDTFVIFEYDTLDPSHNVFDTVILPSVGWGRLAIDYGTGTDSRIMLTGVPEPSSFLLLVLAGLGLCFYLCRKVG